MIHTDGTPTIAWAPDPVVNKMKDDAHKLGLNLIKLSREALTTNLTEADLAWHIARIERLTS